MKFQCKAVNARKVLKTSESPLMCLAEQVAKVICKAALLQYLKTVIVLSHLVFISSSLLHSNAATQQALLFSSDLFDKAVTPKKVAGGQLHLL